MTIRIVLADDSYIVREGVRELLRTVDDIEVIATCSDLDSLQAAIDTEHPGLEVDPVAPRLYLHAPILALQP